MLHPATRLLAWSALVVLVQLARGPFVGCLGLLVFTAGYFLARNRCWRLLRRVRFLLLVLFVLFAFFTPGEALIPAIGNFSPTLEGLLAAGLQGLRLATVVVLVALLLERTSQAALVGGLAFLARPLAVFGFSADRLAIRMLLVLQYVSAPPDGGWRAFLVAGDEPLPHVPMKITRARLGWLDWTVMVGGVLIAFVVGVLA